MIKVRKLTVGQQPQEAASLRRNWRISAKFHAATGGIRTLLIFAFQNGLPPGGVVATTSAKIS
jgi:hypothetical protein